MNNNLIYRTIPRVACEVSMGLMMDPSAPVPVKMRDDLDPHDPPSEYADGRVSWSGYPTREERVAGRERRRLTEIERRAVEAHASAAAQNARRNRLTEQAWVALKTCDHKHTAYGRDHCFTHSVAQHPYTEENPRAHGGIRYDEICPNCHCRRSVNANCGSREYSTWSPDGTWIEDEVG